MLVGLVSDSHGLSDPALPALLGGCALILHAGDLVKPEVLAALRALAPVEAVRGNNDAAGELSALPEHRLVSLGALRALLVHDVGSPERVHPPVAALLRRHRPDVVVHGHSHRPRAALVQGVLFVNPGSAGPRRFDLPRCAGLLRVEGRAVEVALHDLAASPPRPLGPPLRIGL